MPYSVITQQLKFTTSELQNLPPLIGGFFVLSCYATDEIAQMQRLMIATNANISEHEVTGVFAVTQLNSVLRNLSSKLIKYDKALRDLNDRARLQGEQEVIEFIQNRSLEYRELRKGMGFKFAEYLRNKLTNHYLIDNAIDALGRRDTRHVHSIYPAQTYINSHYLLGEEIFFLDAFSNPDVVGENFNGRVIPPFLMGSSRRIHAAVFSFMAGVMPPMPMLGRSLL